jgi:hypothetical protein
MPRWLVRQPGSLRIASTKSRMNYGSQGNRSGRPAIRGARSKAHSRRRGERDGRVEDERDAEMKVEVVCSCLSGCFSRPQYVVLATKLADKSLESGRDRSHIAGFVRPPRPELWPGLSLRSTARSDRPHSAAERRCPPAVGYHNIWWLAETTVQAAARRIDQGAQKSCV